ncbi:response regulator transcription factor [Bordetella pseudohinzii]|uniref:DNA-binding response regulator n=1 Tax=Bordetella pseudohinzii TaxID=1331258 RepID=A0A0J6C3P9_9BORD|nr:response regulator transcription factor [Bordetella pseudohinzii]ANY15195.1 DNA-binding response regulator [Bordetella pseudohinzii]KMM23902.1 LuxR family transcriptional regulator [Bordetella pseudohinzii]KXA75378.1 LuxR family transcriptional regulator [Bordetella pseudohinzii]KXA76369.1 LuxR family transcriptional regulator [Bordetella pseudohinzii]CUI50650.1 Response regulator protein vraR [Bordetella pseudohinzii]
MTTVLLVDDHTMFREGLALALQHAAPTLQLLPAATGAQALALLDDLRGVDLVVMDYYLPDMAGTELLRRLRQRRPQLRILVLSASEDPEDRRRALEAGAQDYLHKSASSRTLAAALASLGQARPGMPPAADAAPDAAALLRTLTPRQVDVLRLMCDGLRNKAISEQLNMSEKTVKSHVSAILGTLGVLNRTQATLVARRGGLFGKPA